MGLSIQTILVSVSLLLGTFLLPVHSAAARAFAQSQTSQLSTSTAPSIVENAWKPVPKPLATRWTKNVSPNNALPEYPRPQMVRKAWKNLNGLWDYALASANETGPPSNYQGRILVPYPFESSLSGIGKPSPTKQRLWYKRIFTIPSAWKKERVLLHFGACNWDCTVAVNGKSIGSHRGGYDSFTFDITTLLIPGNNELIVSAWNPLLHDTPEGQALGKQRETPASVLYTASTGIWQTVWLEPVQAEHIFSLKITPNLDSSKLLVKVDSDKADHAVAHVTVRDNGRVVASISGPADTTLELPIAHPILWSPENPHLYQLSASLHYAGRIDDRVESYAAMRKISLGKDSRGRTTIFLNGKSYFQVGALDQGYWPDGVYTAPTDEALRYDIEMAKKLGFNLLRKHAKVEPDRWYYWTDKLGILVWQDMPQMFGEDFTAETKEQFLAEWLRIVSEFYNHPSIIVWTLFNENWGQHDTEAIAARTKQVDPTRLVDAASGGVYYMHNGKRGRFREDLHAGIGDIIDQHDYPNPTHVKPDENRAAVTGEFGGITMSVHGHRWTQRVFAYGSLLRGSWFLTKRYQDLLKQAWLLKAELGTSALVYTQLTDVEAEINGLMTYDRAVVKPIVSVIAAANRGEFPEMPPNPNLVFMSTSEKSPQTWKYTNREPNSKWFTIGYDDSAWEREQGPITNGESGIWMRREFLLPAGFPRSLSIMAKSNEDEEIYINGVLAAELHGWHGDSYFLQIIKTEAIAKLRTGSNIVAVHAHPAASKRIIDVGITEDDK